MKEEALTANSAVAEAMRQIRPQVVAAYPITPQTDVVEDFAGFVNDGLVKTQYIPVESEHSAMSCCVGAAAAGGRVMTATSSQGLAYMLEMLFIASGLRLPIVMAVANRSLSAPLNIHCDHSDSMAARDSGWIQLYCQDAQEAYDSTIQAVKISEDMRLPVMVCYDGFVISHCLTSVRVEDDEEVQKFVGKYKPFYPLLNLDHPVTYGPLDLYDYYFEHKRQQSEALNLSRQAILETGRLFEEHFGRRYGLIEAYKLEEASSAIVLVGSAASTAKVVVDNLQAQGVKVGLVAVRSFRPFPVDELAQVLNGVRMVGVLDRADSPGGQAGPLAIETRAALSSLKEKAPKVLNIVYGLGGRDITLEDLMKVFGHLEVLREQGLEAKGVTYVGLRG